jgi:hypothetical protein
MTEKKNKPDLEPLICKYCGESFIPKSVRGGKACYKKECQNARNVEDRAAWYQAHRAKEAAMPADGHPLPLSTPPAGTGSTTS